MKAQGARHNEGSRRKAQGTSKVINRESINMRWIIRSSVILGFAGAIIFCLSGFSLITDWPERFPATYGFEAMADHNGVIIVGSVDSTRHAYKLGIRPGMEIIGWNTLPLKRKLESIKVRKYRKNFPAQTDQKIKLLLLTRGKPGETAEIFFVTSTGNNRGVRLMCE